MLTGMEYIHVIKNIQFLKILHRNKYKTNKLIGSFKLDVATIWYQKGNGW